MAGSDCCCFGACCDSIDERIICAKREANEEIENSWVYLQQQIRSQGEGKGEIEEEEGEEGEEEKGEKGGVEREKEGKEKMEE